MLRVRTFPTSAEPVGYPNPAIICGTPGCSEPGLVWLRGLDALHYRSGQQRYFSLATQRVAKVLVKPPDHSVP
jgi:hypothetical protein